MSDKWMELPEGWEWIKLSDVAEKVGSGATPRGGSESYKSSGIPLIRSMNIHFDGLKLNGLAYLDDKQAKELKNVEVKENDVLLNITGASIGRVTQAPAAMEGARVNQHVCIIRTHPILNPNFLAKYFASPPVQESIMAEEYGATRQALTKQMILNFDIPLPPLNEQKRIVTKIEELRSRSQKAREALTAIPELCDKFRQSILAAAFRGDLTTDWREQNYTSDEGLQTAIVTEYYSHEIVAPQSWERISFQDVCKVIGGSQPPKEKFIYEPREGYVRLIQIRDYKSDQYATYIPVELAKRFCNKQDIMIGRYGPPIFQILRGLEGAYNVALMKAEPNPKKIDKEFLYYYLQNPNLYNYVAAGSLRTAGQDGVRKEHLNTYPLFLPSLEEQGEIVRRIKFYISSIERIKDQQHNKQILLGSLDRSILAKAFWGELVEQDPNDEPAAVLLERIRAGRDQQAQGKTGKKGRGKTNAG